jgi:hypothetical protein
MTIQTSRSLQNFSSIRFCGNMRMSELKDPPPRPHLRLLSWSGNFCWFRICIWIQFILIWQTLLPPPELHNVHTVNWMLCMYIYLGTGAHFLNNLREKLKLFKSCIKALCLYTVNRPKFGNGPLVRHRLSKLLKNHISAWAEVSDLVQRGDRLYIFFWTNKKIYNWGSSFTLYDLQQMGFSMSKLGFEKCDYVLFLLHDW